MGDRLRQADAAEKPWPAASAADGGRLLALRPASPPLIGLIETVGIALTAEEAEAGLGRKGEIIALLCPRRALRPGVLDGIAASPALAGRLGLAPAPMADGIRFFDIGTFSLGELGRAAEAAFPLRALAAGRTNGEDLVYAQIARKHGLCYAAVGQRHSPCLPAALRPVHAARLAAVPFDLAGRRRLVIAPPIDRLDTTLTAFARRPPPAAQRLAVTTPRRLERRLRASLAEATERRTSGHIAALMPRLSARSCPGGGQRLMIVATPLVLALGVTLRFEIPSLATLLMSVVTFLGLAMIRLAAWVEAAAPAAAAAPLTEAELPRYSVMAALYREANMVPQLVAALDGLDYPRDRLEILLLLEAEDGETQRAAEAAAQGRPHLRVVTVPPGRPRTKPRALAYGLAFCGGDIVTVYDAEDRPDADQLRRAAAALVRGPEHLACVQARLEIEHADSFLKKQFQIEYACLFSGILPWLSRFGLTLPLGGTSNHFKRHALEVSGGWDPYNVTEDADLGARLTRFGFTCQVFDSATAEEAPARLGVWLRQRRRWIKGWLMTWLVHMRAPRQLFADMGPVNGVVFQLHMAANVLAPLVHPVWLVMMAAYLSGMLPLPGDTSFADTLLISAAGLGLVSGYGGNMLLGWRVLGRGRQLHRQVLLMPFYWLLSSLAAWQAVGEVLGRPHHWHKTPHDARPATPGPANGRVSGRRGT